MTIDLDYPNGCSEEFAELCALSTTGELTAEESAMLTEHIAGCGACRGLLEEYQTLATVTMGKLAAVCDSNMEIDSFARYGDSSGAPQFLACLRAHPHPSHSRPGRFGDRVGRSAGWNSIKKNLGAATAAALLLVCVGGAFELGKKMSTGPLRPTAGTVAEPRVNPNAENAHLRMELDAARDAVEASTAKSSLIQKQLASLSEAKASLLLQLGEVLSRETAQSDSLAAVTQQRDALRSQLDDASRALTLARQELGRAQQERETALDQVVTLETKIGGLHLELASASTSPVTTEKFLAADRDIRELMGARQLYIADVFDVQKNGDRSKPFGRVFYTRGKSLIFYAFDLEKQPGYKEAKIFEAWGKPDSSSAKPISLGIFYMDNEQNRRWVVKADNPEVLAQINSVFVTVEPHGGSQNPTGKPFLEAYLHTLPPNHP